MSMLEKTKRSMYLKRWDICMVSI